MKRLLALLLLLFVIVPLAAAKVSIGGPTAPDGKTQVDVDLPTHLLKRNISSRGLGCCVFRSLEYSAIWQDVPQFYGFPEWMVKKGIPGGGYPDKAAKLITQISKDRGMPVPTIIQYEGSDPAILKAALRSGRLPAITYCGRDPHYNGATVAHMTNLVAYDEAADLCGVCDNNAPKDVVWMNVKEFLERWKGNGGGWAVVLVDSAGPPPVPKNK